MGPRRDLRRTISDLQKQFLQTQATGAERDSVKKRLLALKKQYADLIQGKELTITDEEIDERTSVIESTPELAECFGAFWFVMLPHTVDGILQRPAYIKLQMCLQQCLGGTIPEAEAIANAEADWAQDVYLFGPMNKAAFFGVLFEVLHDQVDIQFTQNYAIFAWNLLTSIADLASYPPQLRIRRTIPCLSLTKEAARLQAYRNDAPLRKQIFEKISSAAYTATGNVEALARASQRTKQVAVDAQEEDHMRSMLMVLQRQALKNQTEQGSGTDTDDDDTMTDSVRTQEEIGWRRAETERQRKQEEDRIAFLAAQKKKKRRPLKNRNSRSYFLEAGRGEGSDTVYDIYGDIWGQLAGTKGGNWIGKQTSMAGGWRATALMEFLEKVMTSMTAGKTAEEIQGLAGSMDMGHLRILWLQELSRREAERQFVEGCERGVLEPLAGVFGIMGRSFERVESKGVDGMKSRGGPGGSPDQGATQVAEHGLAIGGGPRPRKEKPKLTKSGREALELLRRAPERRMEDLSRVLLMSTGELGRVVNRSNIKPAVALTSTSTGQLADLGGWVAQLTPSYSRNARSKPTRPLDTKFEPFLPLTLGGEESEKARRARDKDKQVLDPHSLATRQPPPPLTLLKGLRALQSKGLLLASPRSRSPHSLASFASGSTPSVPETGHVAASSPSRPGSTGSALTSATNVTTLTAVSGLTGMGGRRRRGRDRSRSRSPAPETGRSKSKPQTQTAALSAEHREGVLLTMPLLLRNQIAAPQVWEQNQRRLQDLEGFARVDVGIGTQSPGSAGLGAEPFEARSGIEPGWQRPATGRDAVDSFPGAVAERSISTPFPSIDVPDLVSPPPLLRADSVPNSLALQMGVLAIQGENGGGGQRSRGLALPGTRPSPKLVPARFRDDGSLSGSGTGGEDSGSESAYTFASPVFIAQHHLDDGRVEALVKESMRLRARQARDAARALGKSPGPGTAALDDWVDGGPFPPGSVPDGLDADSWVSCDGESVSKSLSPSKLRHSSSVQSTNTSNANRPQLILPPLLVLLEALYINSSAPGPRWGGAGAKARRGKEQDAKLYAETMPL